MKICFPSNYNTTTMFRDENFKTIKLARANALKFFLGFEKKWDQCKLKGNNPYDYYQHWEI